MRWNRAPKVPGVKALWHHARLAGQTDSEPHRRAGLPSVMATGPHSYPSALTPPRSYPSTWLLFHPPALQSLWGTWRPRPLSLRLPLSLKLRSSQAGLGQLQVAARVLTAGIASHCQPADRLSPGRGLCVPREQWPRESSRGGYPWSR